MSNTRTRPVSIWDTYYGEDMDGEPACFPCLYFDWGCVILFDYNHYEEQLALI